jgi:cell division protein FtsL
MSALRNEAIAYEQEYLDYNPKKKRIKTKNKNRIVIESFKNTAMVAITFVLGILIIYNYAVITDKKMEINKINEEIIALNNDIDKYNVSLESIKNTNKIEEMAKTYLGMNYPTRKQTVFIDFAYGQTEENTNLPIEKSQNQLYGLIDKVIGFIQ